MEYYYYINSQQEKDGPHDLVVMMRRIRSGVVRPDTLVYKGQDDEVAAHLIPELSDFFNRPADMRQELVARPSISISKTLQKGWDFMCEYQFLPVFAGLIILLVSLLGIILAKKLSLAAGIIGGWMFFLLLQSYFFAVSIRLYRGQKIDMGFIENVLSPISAKLAFAAIVFALIIAAGLVLGIVGGIVAMVVFMLIPLSILDHDYTIKQSVTETLRKLKKLEKASIIDFGWLMLIYLLCIVLILPIPLLLPVIAGGICYIYDELLETAT